MKRVGLCVYGFSLYDSEAQTTINLNEVKESKNILEIIKQYIDDNGNKYENDTSKERLYKFSDVKLEEIKIDEKKEYSILYGCVKTGEYGVQSELIDIIDNSTYNKKSTQADVLPFGFCVALAKGDKTKAVILLQTLGNLGIKTVFGKYINRCMLENKIDYSIVWGPLYPKQYIQRILQKGVLQKIRMIRYEIPEDTIDRLGVNNGVKLKEERVIIHPVGFLHNKEKQLKEWLNGQRASTKIIELPDFEYEQLKFEFEINKKKKTINLNDTEELRINEDITDSVRMENGVPTFESVKECLKITSYEYLKLIGFIAK